MNRARVLTGAPAVALLLAGLSITPSMASDLLGISPQATLVSRGLAVDVPVTYTCDPPSLPDNAFLAMTVYEVVRGQVTGSTTYSYALVCDGTPQATTLRVQVNPGNMAFKPGKASVQASLNVYRSGSYDSVNVSREVQIRK